MHLSSVVPTIVAGAALVSAQCVIPMTPLPGTISAPFRVQVQNASRPEVHNKYMNLFVAGAGDRHLFIGPVGNPTYDLTLIDGVINWVAGGIRAVIGGEYSDIDHTTKMFMTERGDPRAIFEPTNACDPDDPTQTQVELRFVTWQSHPAGGWICVRPAFDGGYEFRYYPPDNNLVDPNRECIKVTLVVRPSGDGPLTSTTSGTTTASSDTSATSAAPSSTATTTPALFTDMTAMGFRFIGCAPEERRVDPFDFYGRTLPDAVFSGDNMTNELCLSSCAAAGYIYAGTEWSRECWCANAYAPTRQPGTTVASVGNCNFRCSGDVSQFCGGDAWLSLYQKCLDGVPCVNNVFT
ncbi:WSC domain-containing protein [Echria macrotheca]|uniref:WSC domain-containing protein n=1 Tax=Echria macrotheca TaxID=438768 RepID=A0AAJ0F8N4_9PEZI|nr:WSC domain-containing protein [Echria macrotheca]